MDMKKVLIVGASSGLGYATAEALASRNVKVGVAARHTDRLEELKKKYPDYVEYAKIDITKEDAVEQLHRLIDRLGGMDIYFHVAGVLKENPSLYPEREVETLNTNVVGFARMVSAAYRYFRDHGVKGQIAAITSVAGTKGIGRMSAYSASKSFDQAYLVALEQLANAEGVEVSFTDIRPGWVMTPLLEEGRKYPMAMQTEEVVPQIIKAIVRKRRVAVIDCRWAALVALWRLLPNCLWTRLDIPVSTPR